jgi:hypothetical protein
MAANIQVPRLAPMGAGGSAEQALAWQIGHDTQLQVGVFQVIKAGALLIVARLALLVLGFRRTAAVFHRLSGGVRRRPSIEPPRVHSTTYAISLAASLIPSRMLCLERSLALYYSLRRDGIPAKLRLGVRALPFGAHAWVELLGSPVNDDLDRMRDLNPILELS